jgi:hypothetical protein
MYTNIPTLELANIIKNILNNDYHTSKEEKKELLYILDTIFDLIINFSNEMRDNGSPHLCYISGNIHTTF